MTREIKAKICVIVIAVGLLVLGRSFNGPFAALILAAALAGCGDDPQSFDLTRLSAAHRVDFLAAAVLVNAQYNLHIHQGPGPSVVDYDLLPYPYTASLTGYDPHNPLRSSYYVILVRPDLICPDGTYQPIFRHEQTHISIPGESADNPSSGCHRA